MKRSILVLITVMFLAAGVFAQDEYIQIMDFETELFSSVPGWVQFHDFSFGDEPVHSGDQAVLLEIDGTGGWSFGWWQFPQAYDLSQTDEIHIWVNADAEFNMNLELAGINLGYRDYEEADIGNWKELVWWYPESTAAAMSEVSGWGTFISPNDGFTGTMYMDDIQAHIRPDPPEREYFLINGFNSESDLENVVVTDAVFGGILNVEDPPPTEGDGYLMIFATDSSTEHFSVDLSDVEKLASYDRFHFDVFFDGTASWGNFTCQFRIDGDSTQIIGGSYKDGASLQWREYSGQYAPVPETEGFLLQDFKEEELIPALNSGSTVEIYFTGNGGGMEGQPLYFDNLRLSRPVGTDVTGWELY